MMQASQVNLAAWVMPTSNKPLIIHERQQVPKTGKSTTRKINLDFTGSANCIEAEKLLGADHMVNMMEV